MMTKKHFEALAKIIAKAQGTTESAELMRLTIAEDLAHECARENPNFNRSRFLTACKVIAS